MVDATSAIAAILVMMLVTMATRFGGVWIMSRFTISPRLEIFLKYMAVSVLISIVVPAARAAAPRIWIAVAASAAAMLATRNVLAAMLAGVVLAALGRSVGL